MNSTAHAHIVRFVNLRHEVPLIARILDRFGFRGRFLLVRRFGRGTLLLITDTSHNPQMQTRNLCSRSIEGQFPRLLRLPEPFNQPSPSGVTGLFSPSGNQREGSTSHSPENTDVMKLPRMQTLQVGGFPPSVSWEFVGNMQETSVR